MKKIVFMLKIFFAIILLWIPKEVFSYIHKIKVYQHKETKQTIILMSDWHCLGTYEDELEQFEKFKKIHTALKNKPCNSQLLFEKVDKYTFNFYANHKNKSYVYYLNPIYLDNISIDLNILEEQMQIQIPTKSIQLDKDEKTWIFKDETWEYLSKNETAKIRYKSIDRRAISVLWNPELTNIFKEFQKIEYLTHYNSISLFQEKILEQNISTELKKILHTIYNTEHQKIFNNKINKALQDPDKLIDIIGEELALNHSIFSSALEHEAILFLCSKHIFQYSFLFAGGGHIKNLLPFIEQLGFYLIKTFGISAKDIKKLYDEQKLDIEEDEPPKLDSKNKAAIEKGLDYILETLK